MSEKTVRPPHTSMAAGFVIGGSVGIVVTIAGQLAGLHSLETQKQVTSFVTDGPGAELGMDLETALDWMRVILMVVAGCATAAVVLAIQVLRCSRGARALLTVLAFPIFLGGFVAGGFLTALVAASIALLWVGPSAQWLHDGPATSNRRFLDRPILPVDAERERQQPPPPSPPSPPSSSPSSSPSSAPAQHRPSPQPGTARQLFVDRPPAPGSHPRRPDAVVWACMLVWAGCGLVVVAMAITVAVVAGDPAFVLDQLRQQDEDLAVQDPDVLVNATYVTAAVLVVWSAGAAVLAVLAYRRRRPGRLGVLVSAAVTGVLCLAGVFASVVLIIPAGAAVATVALLSRPEVRAWYGAR
ncbi:hypothetical protein [Nocardioides sp.]|uniref:hypothetical protein n=1 Tax=Nocardioides sp. TaxID=35761 RepID=UPI002ED1E59B